MKIVPITNLLFHHYGEEAVILNLNTESYFSLNGSGIRMWELLTTMESVAAASAAMAEEYDAPVEVIQTDMEAFVQSLQMAKLVEITD